MEQGKEQMWMLMPMPMVGACGRGRGGSEFVGEGV